MKSRFVLRRNVKIKQWHVVYAAKGLTSSNIKHAQLASISTVIATIWQ